MAICHLTVVFRWLYQGRLPILSLWHYHHFSPNALKNRSRLGTHRENLNVGGFLQTAAERASLLNRLHLFRTNRRLSLVAQLTALSHWCPILKSGTNQSDNHAKYYQSQKSYLDHGQRALGYNAWRELVT